MHVRCKFCNKLFLCEKHRMFAFHAALCLGKCPKVAFVLSRCAQKTLAFAIASAESGLKSTLFTCTHARILILSTFQHCTTKHNIQRRTKQSDGEGIPEGGPREKLLTYAHSYICTYDYFYISGYTGTAVVMRRRRPFPMQGQLSEGAGAAASSFYPKQALSAGYGRCLCARAVSR